MHGADLRPFSLVDCSSLFKYSPSDSMRVMSLSSFVSSSTSSRDQSPWPISRGKNDIRCAVFDAIAEARSLSLSNADRYSSTSDMLPGCKPFSAKIAGENV